MYTRSITLTIESKIADVALLAEAVKAICRTTVRDETILYNLVLCLVEAVTNVINHAYHRRPGNFVEVKVTLDDRNVWYEISDTGEKAELPPPKKDLLHDSNDITSLPESGMGLFLIHQIMQEVATSQKDGKNVLSMRKILR